MTIPVMHAYKIINSINGKAYIGIARDARRRWRVHKAASANKPGALYDAMRKYGVENFTFNVIACARTWEGLCALEVILIKQHGTFYGNRAGYNMTLGGEGGNGAERSQKFRETLSLRTKEMWRSPELREKFLAAHRGSRRSKETCAKISLRAKQRAPHPNAIDALRRASDARRGTGRPPDQKRIDPRRKACPLSRHECGKLGGAGLANSAEGRARIGRANSKRVVSAETKAKLSLAGKGRPRTTEWKAKISAAHKGRKKSPEWAAKIAAANRKRAAA